MSIEKIGIFIVMLIIFGGTGGENLSAQDSAQTPQKSVSNYFFLDRLQVELLDEPEGIDVAEPTFRWTFGSAKNCFKQSAYQIRVYCLDYQQRAAQIQNELASNPSDDSEEIAARWDEIFVTDYQDYALDELVWDSGKVMSDRQSFIRYEGKPLQPGRQYAVLVNVWDQDDAMTQDQTRFSTGLFPTADNPQPWKGQWIGSTELTPSEPTASIQNAAWIAWGETCVLPIGKSIYRKTFDVDSPEDVEFAYAHFACDDSSQIFLNGQEIGTLSGFNTASAFDLTQALCSGKNVLAFRVDNGGVNDNPTGLLGGVLIKKNNGETTEILTDESWKASKGGEKEWLLPDFDDSVWANAHQVAVPGDAPWGAVTTSSLHQNALPARYLAKNVLLDLTKPIIQATANISGLGYYELAIDGQRIGDHCLDSILTHYDVRVPYNTYDVTKLLNEYQRRVSSEMEQAGLETPTEPLNFSVVLGNGRFFPPRGTKIYGVPRLLFQLDVQFADGSRQTFVSDESWKISTQGPIRENNDYDGEIFDTRQYLPTDQASLSDTLFWTRDESASQTFPASLRCVATDQNVEVLEAPLGKLTAVMMPPMRVLETIEPIAIVKKAPGRVIYDLGQNIVGWAKIAVQGKAGDRVHLRFAETLNEQGELYVANLRSAKCRDLLILGEDSTLQVYHPRFSYHGFRYVEVTVPETTSVFSLEGQVVGTDLPRVGSFECSNPTINQTFQNIYWGTRGNYLSIPTDCPQRDERQGWLGDRASGSMGEMFLFDNISLYRKWMQDIEDSQKPDGNVSDVCPPYWELYGSNVTWPSAQSIIPYSMYLMYGDTTSIAKHYDSRKKWLAHIATFLLPDGTLEIDNYGDWCVPPESKELIHSLDPARQTNRGLLATSYYIYNLKLAALFADMLQKTDDATEFRARAETMTQAFNAKFYRADLGQYDNGSQTSCVLPLYFGLVPEGDEDRVFDKLTQNIEQVTQRHIGTGLIGCQWINRTLSDRGRIDLSYDFSTNRTYPSWGYMTENGATTIWELWNGDTADPAMNSGNHVMLVGDLAIWYFEYLAGIKADPSRPGFERVLMSPNVVGDLTKVHASYDSIRGEISSAWQYHEKLAVFDWEVAIPANSTALISVPTDDPASVTVYRCDVLESDPSERCDCEVKIDAMDKEPGRAQFELGSGRYRIMSHLSP